MPLSSLSIHFPFILCPSFVPFFLTDKSVLPVMQLHHLVYTFLDLRYTYSFNFGQKIKFLLYFHIFLANTKLIISFPNVGAFSEIKVSNAQCSYLYPKSEVIQQTFEFARWYQMIKYDLGNKEKSNPFQMYFDFFFIEHIWLKLTVKSQGVHQAGIYWISTALLSWAILQILKRTSMMQTKNVQWVQLVAILPQLKMTASTVSYFSFTDMEIMM